MEVHAHTHTARKKWTHYLWEFLMLFLAVFCGFLAENQREHYIEKLRAKQYARSLIRDLAKDTLMAKSRIREINENIIMIDSLAYYLRNKEIDQIKNIDFFFLIYPYNDIYRPYTWNRATIDQVKNSGSLRYFSNDSIVTLISAYDAFSKHLDDDYKGDEQRAMQTSQLTNRVINLDYPEEFIRGMISNKDSIRKTPGYNRLETDGPTILTKDLKEIKVLLNEKIIVKENFVARGKSELPRLIRDADALIHLLKKEYHFE